MSSASTSTSKNVIRAILPRLFRSPRSEFKLSNHWGLATLGTDTGTDSCTSSSKSNSNSSSSKNKGTGNKGRTPYTTDGMSTTAIMNMNWSPRALLTEKRRRNRMNSPRNNDNDKNKNTNKNTNSTDDDDDDDCNRHIGLLDFLSSSSSSSEQTQDDAYYFPPSSVLTIKTSKHDRFFMYEEQKQNQTSTSQPLHNTTNTTTTIQQCVTPLQFAEMLHTTHTTTPNKNNMQDSNSCYCYWTGTIQDFAPHLLKVTVNDNNNNNDNDDDEDEDGAPIARAPLIDSDLLSTYFFDDVDNDNDNDIDNDNNDTRDNDVPSSPLNSNSSSLSVSSESESGSYSSTSQQQKQQHSTSTSLSSSTIPTPILPTIELDPRGPSLWMGSSGSSTQAHYDIADNLIVQLYGTKRIRIYKPSTGVSKLHFYPDTHAKARKSQVNFDFYPTVVGAVDPGDPLFDQATNLYPHVSVKDIATPVLDVILSPGDMVRIPAFWIHHIENGIIPTSTSTSTPSSKQQQQILSSSSSSSSISKKQQEEESDTTSRRNTVVDGPSVSMNIFAISEQMKVARTIFQEGSHPFHNNNNNNNNPHCYDSNNNNASNQNEKRYQFAIIALSTLGHELIKRIRSLVQQQQQQQQQKQSSSSSSSSSSSQLFSSSSHDFIRIYLLEARYIPLQQQHQDNSNHNKCTDNDNHKNKNPATMKRKNNVDYNNHRQTTNNSKQQQQQQQQRKLTVNEKEMVHDCINRLLPYFETLLQHGHGHGSSSCCNLGEERGPAGDGEGIVAVVVCHLLELWAVEMVGEENVGTVWKDALYYLHRHNTT